MGCIDAGLASLEVALVVLQAWSLPFRRWMWRRGSGERVCSPFDAAAVGPAGGMGRGRARCPTMHA